MLKAKFTTVLLILLSGCVSTTENLSLPTVAVLPTTFPTIQSAQVIVLPTETATPTNTAEPSTVPTFMPTPLSLIHLPSATSTATPSPSPAITKTSLPMDEPTSIPGSDKWRFETGATLASPLSAAYMQIKDVQAVFVIVIPKKDGEGFLVGGDAKVVRGANMLTIATSMRDLSYRVLGTAFVDFSIILDDGAQAVDYVWDNNTDSWRVIKLTITAVPLPS